MKNGQKRVLRVQNELAGKSLNMHMNVGVHLNKEDALLIDMRVSIGTV